MVTPLLSNETIDRYRKAVPTLDKSTCLISVKVRNTEN